MLVGPWSSLMSATTESGTPPCRRARRAAPATVRATCRSPRAASSSCTRIGTRRSPASNFASAGPDVADGGDADGLRQAFGGDAEPCREIGARLDAQLRTIERAFPRSRWRSAECASSASPVRWRRCRRCCCRCRSPPARWRAGRFRRGTSNGCPERFSSSLLISSSSSRWVMSRSRLWGVVDDQSGAPRLHECPAERGRRRRIRSSPRAACAAARRCPR